MRGTYNIPFYSHSPKLEHASPSSSMQAHARACKPMLEHASPCSSILAHARGVAINAIIYIEDERETWRTRQIKIFIYIYI